MKTMVTEEKEKNVGGRSGEKCEVVLPQLLLQKQGNYYRAATLTQTKARRAEILEDCLQQCQNGHRCVVRHRDRKSRVDVAGGDGTVTIGKKRDDKMQKKKRLEKFIELLTDVI